MPVAEGDLRETFDLPMMTEAASPAPAGRPLTAGAGPVADALVLFDDRPQSPRRKTGAEARAQARRCPNCQGAVPAGMSLCQVCGFDLETGTKISLADELIPPPPPAPAGLPLDMTIIGCLCVAMSIALAAAAVVFAARGAQGALYFLPVAAFGGFAAYQFLRRKSVKMLMVALTLGAAIDVIALVALPIYNANAETTVVQRSGTDDDPDAADEMITPVLDRLDTDRISTGFAVLAVYAVLSIYLLSARVGRQFRK
jgi:hypothetical protein